MNWIHETMSLRRRITQSLYQELRNAFLDDTIFLHTAALRFMPRDYPGGSSIEFLDINVNSDHILILYRNCTKEGRNPAYTAAFDLHDTNIVRSIIETIGRIRNGEMVGERTFKPV